MIADIGNIREQHFLGFNAKFIRTRFDADNLNWSA
jgi:hypothetical protein